MDIDQALRATDQMMLEVVGSDVSVLEEASRHIIGAGGKRIRPRLLFLGYKALGGDDLARAVPVASAIEIVHTATLVHDDINDHGVTRRGRVTVNERWGRTFALLTGDFLFTKVYWLMAPYGDLNITLAEATVALVEGETLQAQAARDNTLNREVYQKIVAKKTASLFRAAGMLGAQLARAKQEHVDALGEFGFFLGLAFQIVDDILDLTGDPTLMGKAAGVDLPQGKGVGAAVVYGAQGGNGIATAPPTTEPEGDPFAPIKRRLIEGGAVEEGRQMAQMIAAQALAALNKLPESPYRAELARLVDMVINRDH